MIVGAGLDGASVTITATLVGVVVMAISHCGLGPIVALNVVAQR